MSELSETAGGSGIADMYNAWESEQRHLQLINGATRWERFRDTPPAYDSDYIAGLAAEAEARKESLVNLIVEEIVSGRERGQCFHDFKAAIWGDSRIQRIINLGEWESIMDEVESRLRGELASHDMDGDIALKMAGDLQKTDLSSRMREYLFRTFPFLDVNGEISRRESITSILADVVAAVREVR